MTPGAVYHKTSGRRGWSKGDIDTALDFFSSRLGRRVPYEEVFGDPTDTNAAPSPEAA